MHEMFALDVKQPKKQLIDICQGNHYWIRKPWSIVLTGRYIIHMQALLGCCFKDIGVYNIGKLKFFNLSIKRKRYAVNKAINNLNNVSYRELFV